MTSQPMVQFSMEDAVATITLDSPHNRNALSRRLLAELSECLSRADDDRNLRVVLLRSAGSVFCSGADLTEAASLSMQESARRTIAVQRQILAAATPIVVRLDGAVRAGGLGIVGAADIVLASTDVNFALTEARLALAPAVISLTLLPRLTQRGSSDAFLTGRTFTADEAQVMGLVTRAVPASKLSATVEQTIHELEKAHPQGLRATKGLLNRDLLARIDAMGDELSRQSAELFASSAAQERIAALMSDSPSMRPRI